MYKQISDYLAKDIYPFHMPGHKRNPQFMPPYLLELDMTEIPGMDVLSSPTGIIKELQENIAEFYGADHSFFLVNGSSAGVLAAVCAACTDGETIIVPRNAHTSVYNAMVMSGAVPKYVMPEITVDGLAGGIAPSAFDNMPKGAAVLVVSPTYEGFVSDISAIADRVHSKGGVLIVDEAHGAHFPFHDKFPASALSHGADIVIQSFHKTLPAPSQCAVLHIKDKNVDINRIKFYTNTVQTSSPSYILMAVCDYMLRQLWQQPKLFEDYFHRLETIRASLPGANSSTALRLSGAERIGENAIFDVDPGKLLFTSHSGISVNEITSHMTNGYKVQPEMAVRRHILAMTSVADTDEGFRRLKTAIDGLNAKLPVVCADNLPHEPFFMPEIVVPPRQAVNMPSRRVPWEDAAGQISAQLIAQYPPGIAIVAPGECIPPGLPRYAEIVCVIGVEPHYNRKVDSP
ncbi:MAG: aminotransferase class I/II-fold pyridoxal phosphate-dependent enzyme [Firmicutes bacterium]|nr:aminotransferase class I/II-fold pyridoxal phosphate-dependent enzyme [Bacillota bacterium]